jgi:N-acetylglucosaminyl-diphospho-decaprenol L-rhamnosyltransferase
VNLSPDSINSVAIIIVNWNGGGALGACIAKVLDAQRALPALKLEIIICDNASTDGSIEQIGESESLRIIRNKQNLGFGAACNRAVSASTSDAILFLNPDLMLDPESLRRAAVFLSEDSAKKYAGCGISLYAENGQLSRTCSRKPTFIDLLLGTRISNRVRKSPFTLEEKWHYADNDVFHSIAAFLLIRRSVFAQLNGFDENFPLYLEDLDLSERIQAGGWKIRFLHCGSTIHIGGGTSKQIPVERIALSLAARIIYARKHFSKAEAFLITSSIYTLESPIRLVYFIITQKRPALKLVYLLRATLNSHKRNHKDILKVEA